MLHSLIRSFANPRLFIPLFSLMRLPSGVRQLALLEYEFSPYRYFKNFEGSDLGTILEVNIAAYPIMQFLLGVVTVGGIVALFDIRTRRLGLLTLLPPTILRAIEWSSIGGLKPTLYWLIALWILVLLFRRTKDFEGAERVFYQTGALFSAPRSLVFASVLLFVLVISAKVFLLRNEEGSARDLVGRREVNRRGTWQFRNAYFQGAQYARPTYTLYLSSVGFCIAVQAGKEFRGTLLTQRYGKQLYLDCLPHGGVRGEFSIAGDTLTIRNTEDAPPFEITYTKKDWGPGWYDSFLPCIKP